jgi:CheY-like chemotaxis protein
MPVTVVAVEDNAFLRSLIVTLLEDEFVDVADFESADDALIYLREHASHVAALFTDINLPGKLDGLGLASIAAREWPHISLLVTSADVPKPWISLPPNAGFALKPWRPREVLAFVLEASTAVRH